LKCRRCIKRVAVGWRGRRREGSSRRSTGRSLRSLLAPTQRMQGCARSWACRRCPRAGRSKRRLRADLTTSITTQAPLIGIHRQRRQRRRLHLLPRSTTRVSCKSTARSGALLAEFAAHPRVRVCPGQASERSGRDQGGRRACGVLHMLRRTLRTIHQRPHTPRAASLWPLLSQHVLRSLCRWTPRW
jgi:hypothetical protein